MSTNGPWPNLTAMRCDYTLGKLSESELAQDWLTQFRQWLADAAMANLTEPNAAVLATASAAGEPKARSVLVKECDERGFVFFTNYQSRKAQAVAENPQASLVFPWYVLQRQVIVCGQVERTSREESLDYFRKRPRGARIGALASPQSQVVTSRDELEAEVARITEKYPKDVEIPLPDEWGGLRIVPHTVEFWQGRHDRLHDRLQYRKTAESEWIVERLAP